jgi:hypothetical protein
MTKEKSNKSSKTSIVFGTILLLWIIGSCGSNVSDETNSSPTLKPAVTTPKNDAPAVQWEDYAPSVKTRIDDLAAQKDCDALQSEFDNADANNEATMARVGHNNAQLMGYIDFLMRNAGCY